MLQRKRFALSKKRVRYGQVCLANTIPFMRDFGKRLSICEMSDGPRLSHGWKGMAALCLDELGSWMLQRHWPGWER